MAKCLSQDYINNVTFERNRLLRANNLTDHRFIRKKRQNIYISS